MHPHHRREAKWRGRSRLGYPSERRRRIGDAKGVAPSRAGVSRYGPLTAGLWLLLNTALFAQRAVRIDATLNRMIAGTAREYLAFVIAAAVGARAPPDYPHTFAAMLTGWIANPLLI